MVPGRRRVASGAMRIVVFGATGYTGRLPEMQAIEQGVLRTRVRYVMKQADGTWSIVLARIRT